MGVHNLVEFAAWGDGEAAVDIAEPDDHLGKAGLAEELLEFWPERGDLYGLIEERRLHVVAAGLEQHTAQRLAGHDPVALGVSGGAENGEDRRLIGDMAILGTFAVAHIKRPDSELGERAGEPGDGNAVAFAMGMHPGGQFAPPTGVGPVGGVPFGD